MCPILGILATLVALHSTPVNLACELVWIHSNYVITRPPRYYDGWSLSISLIFATSKDDVTAYVPEASSLDCCFWFVFHLKYLPFIIKKNYSVWFDQTLHFFKPNALLLLNENLDRICGVGSLFVCFLPLPRIIISHILNTHPHFRCMQGLFFFLLVHSLRLIIPDTWYTYKFLGSKMLHPKTKGYTWEELFTHSHTHSYMTTFQVQHAVWPPGHFASSSSFSFFSLPTRPTLSDATQTSRQPRWPMHDIKCYPASKNILYVQKYRVFLLSGPAQKILSVSR